MNAVIGVPVAFLVILILVRKKVSYGLSIMCGGATIGLFYGFGIQGFLRAIYRTLVNGETLNLTSIIILIGILGYGFKKTGHITIIIEETRKMLGEKTLLAVIPSLFGMLPIPGGALMSAPVIEPEARRLGLTPEQKTYLNIWFRHILVLIFPLNSSLILVASLSQTNIYTLIAWFSPLFLISTAVGYFLVIKPIKTTSKRDSSGNMPRVLWGLSPILLVIFLNIGFNVGFAAGLCLGILLLFLVGRVSAKGALEIARKGFSKQMALAMVGIMFFRQVINDSGVVNDVMNLVEGSPVILLIIILPLLIGLFSGMSLLPIGVTFPLLFPLSPLPAPLFGVILYVSSHIGYLTSPLHLCLIVTNEYFGSSLWGVYKKLLPSAIFLLVYLICFAILFVLHR